jgi:hypothetical protein
MRHNEIGTRPSRADLLITAGHAAPIADAALLYAATGLTIFPLWWIIDGRCACSKGDACDSPGKHPIGHPAGAPNGVNNASNDVQQVTAWWRRWPHANIGLPAGKNELAIIDIDPDHGGADTFDVLHQWALRRGIDLTATVAGRTGRGGLHLFYQAPPGGIASKVAAFGPDAPGIDTRGRGGYVVAPPSAGILGPYAFAEDGPRQLLPWPTDLTQLMEPPAPAPVAYRPATAPSNVGGWAAAALQGECAQTASAATGGRNRQLYRSAVKLGRIVAAGQLDAYDVAGQLHTAAVAAGLGDTEARKTIDSGLQDGLEIGPRLPKVAERGTA